MTIEDPRNGTARILKVDSKPEDDLRSSRLRFFTILFILATPIFSESLVPELLKARQFGGVVAVIYNNGLLSESLGRENEKFIVENCGTISISNILAFNPNYSRLFAEIQNYKPKFVEGDSVEDSRVVVEFYRGGVKFFSFSLGSNGRTVYHSGLSIVDDLGFAKFVLDQLPSEEVRRLREVGNLYGRIP